MKNIYDKNLKTVLKFKCDKIESTKGITFVKLIIIILMCLILFGIVIFILNKNQGINYIQQIIKGEEEKIIEDGISYVIYDNTKEEKLKTLITIKRKNGINKIEYVDDENKSNIVHCDNKKKMSIDFDVEIGKEYNFKVISNGIEEIERVIVNENYIDEYIRFDFNDGLIEGNKVVNIQNDKGIEGFNLKYNYLNMNGNVSGDTLNLKADKINGTSLRNYYKDSDGYFWFAVEVYLGDDAGNKVSKVKYFKNEGEISTDLFEIAQSAGGLNNAGWTCSIPESFKDVLKKPYNIGRR